MERTTLNPERILWCCHEYGLTLEELADQISVPQDTLEGAVSGEKKLTVGQLQKLAKYFNRSLLFFLEPRSVNENKIYSAQFRTIANQKPELSRQVAALVTRVERQRQTYINLLEDLGEKTETDWPDKELKIDIGNIKKAANAVRKWLQLGDSNTFDDYRNTVEAKGVLVFVSNGYAGSWQIAKQDPVRGFSLYYPVLPVIFVKKQTVVAPQAFTIMHELGHLLLHKESILDEEKDFYDYRGKEKDANEFAGNVLVPDAFLEQLHIGAFPFDDVHLYDSFLERYRKTWSVSGEVILRRMFEEDLLTKKNYQTYRDWKASLPISSVTGRASREYRYREPVHMFGKPFVGAVLDALQDRQITLPKASTYLDNIKISDLHKLEDHFARI